MTTPNTPSPEQLAALDRYRQFCKASRVRRDCYWKDALRSDWYRACEKLWGTVMQDDIGHLQTLRNTLGPEWLESFDLDSTLAENAALDALSRQRFRVNSIHTASFSRTTLQWECDTCALPAVACAAMGFMHHNNVRRLTVDGMDIERIV